jgi:hypothetical protein
MSIVPLAERNDNISCGLKDAEDDIMCCILMVSAMLRHLLSSK